MEVKYISHMGTDLSVVNAARVSFAKESTWEKVNEYEGIVFSEKLSDRDAKLIRYLADHGHWTPFAHTAITLHIKAPLFVRTQCFKHKVGFVENEVSRRYVDDEPELYLPYVWRGRAEDKKQGSAGEIVMEQGRYKEHPAYYVEQFYIQALDVYRRALEDGVAPEQARMVLPQSMMTEWYWTGSLVAYARFHAQRTKPDAQEETSNIAHRCDTIIASLFPVSWKALTK